MDKGKLRKDLRKNDQHFFNLFLIFLNFKKQFFFPYQFLPTVPRKPPNYKKYPHIDICYNGISSFVCNNLFCICIELCTVGIDSESLQSARQFCM